VVHQNHDYSHHPKGVEGVWYGAEAQLNRAAGGIAFAFTPVDADWRLSPKGLVRNYCRGDWERYLQLAHILHRGTALGVVLGVVLTGTRACMRIKRRIGRTFRTAKIHR
jgi:hypothetical protein